MKINSKTSQELGKERLERINRKTWLVLVWLVIGYCVRQLVVVVCYGLSGEVWKRFMEKLPDSTSSIPAYIHSYLHNLFQNPSSITTFIWMGTTNGL